ncbi:MAG: glycosyltransferase family 2 protein [Bacteroidia bacterium]
MNPPFISIVSPVYKAEKIVNELIKRITDEVIHLTDRYEIILVEDGSPDNSWAEIAKNAAKDTHIKGIKLSRNFGQHFAITAGLEHAKGDFVIVMDCDLQDDPVYFAQLYEQIKQGYEVVFTQKKQRKHSFFKNMTAKAYNAVFNYLIDNPNWDADSNVGAFSMLSRKVVDAYCQFGDYQRHYLSVIRWLGFSQTFVEIEHRARFEGASSYNFSKLMIHAINGITSQSDKLLRINIVFGIFLSLSSFLAILLIIFLYFTRGFMSGWASLMVTILFSTGILLTSLGVLGIYIGKTFEQTKNRPKYLVDIILNDS